MELAWRLRHYFFTHQEVRANPEHDPEAPVGAGQFRIDLDIAHMEEESCDVYVTLTLSPAKGGWENTPYLFKIEAVAHFSANRPLNGEDDSVIRKEAGRILLGAARDRLMDLSSRGPWGVFLVPLLPLSEETTPRKRAPRRRVPAPAP